MLWVRMNQFDWRGSGNAHKHYARAANWHLVQSPFQRGNRNDERKNRKTIQWHDESNCHSIRKMTIDGDDRNVHHFVWHLNRWFVCLLMLMQMRTTFSMSRLDRSINWFGRERWTCLNVFYIVFLSPRHKTWTMIDASIEIISLARRSVSMLHFNRVNNDTLWPSLCKGRHEQRTLQHDYRLIYWYFMCSNGAWVHPYYCHGCTWKMSATDGKSVLVCA